MKKFLSVIISVCLLGLSARAYDSKAILGGNSKTSAGTTNVIAAATASTANSSEVIDCTKQESVAIQASYSLVGLGCVSNVVFGFQRSVDGSSWDTNLWLFTTQALTNSAATNLNTSVGVTNYTVGGVGYLKLAYWNNQASNVCTNIVIKPSTKPK